MALLPIEKDKQFKNQMLSKLFRKFALCSPFLVHIKNVTLLHFTRGKHKYLSFWFLCGPAGQQADKMIVTATIKELYFLKYISCDQK